MGGQPKNQTAQSRIAAPVRIDSLAAWLTVESVDGAPLILVGRPDAGDCCDVVAGILNALDRRCEQGTAERFGPSSYRLQRGDRL
jgi:hypothetical protein